MPPQTLTSPPIPSPNALDQHVLRTIFTQLKTVTSTTGFNAILEIYDENNKLLDQLKSKGHELASLREEMDEERKRKDIALDEMFQANEKEKGRHKETKKHAQTLQTMINDKDTCISERDKVIDEFGKQVKKLQSDIAMERDKLAVARKEISGLQQSIQEKEATIDKMKAAGTELKDRLNSTKKTVKELQDERTSLRESLTKTDGNLKRLEGYAAGYSEMTEDSVIESFTGLWEYAKMEIFAMLKNDLPRDTLRVLANQAAIDSEKESFCRSVLLSIDPGTQEGICLVGIQAVVKNVSEYLDELLPEDQRLAFHNTLRKVVWKAADIWKPIQHSKRRYEPDFDPPTAEDDCEAFKFPITENVTTENNANQKNMKKVSLTVFPRLSIIEHGISTAYTAIIQVSSSQRQWVAAESEMDKEPASPTTIGRIPWRRKSNTPKTTSVPNGGSKKGNGE
ncbi:hypothetical protein APSETT444_002688 [Aspergillus pseudonomiae]